MTAKANLTKEANISKTVRSIDFVSKFASEWEALKNIMGISREIEKVAGQTMKVVKASITLQSGSVGEGEEIPYSLSSVSEETIGEATLEKYCKAVSIEAINKYGYNDAVARTDAAMLNQLQKNICSKFYTFLNTGSLTAIDSTFQMALAMAKARVLNMFSALDLDCSDVVGFVNLLDFYDYLGGATISVQTAFGMQYVKDFMGYNTVFLCDNDRIARNKVIAVPVENIVCYYINPATSDFAKAGLDFTVDGETPFVGFHTEGDYRTLVNENTAIMGIYLFAEYLNGICVETVDSGTTIGSLTVSTAAGTEETGDSVVTITESAVSGGSFYWKAQASTAPADPTYKAEFDTTGWTKVASGDTVSSTNGHKFRLVEVNGAGQAIASATGTVTAKA